MRFLLHLHVNADVFIPKPMSKTKIMQELILTYARTRKYLDILMKQDLIMYHVNDHIYQLTAKGNEVLKLNQQLADYLLPVKEMIRKYACLMEVPFFDANVIEDSKTVGLEEYRN